jgi:hypothetical protein
VVPATNIHPVTKYAVCLSFAGEDRKYVAEVAEHLKSLGIEHFYDVNEQAELWGKDLSEHLDDIYRKNSRFCVMFVSEHYVRKMWTIHERRSALARGLQNPEQEYVLPVRFDDTEVPGLRPSVGYLDLRTRTPRELAEMIAKKVGVAVGAQQPGWEYQLFSDTVALHMGKLGDKQISHELGDVSPVRTITTDTDAHDNYLARTRTFDEIVNRVTDLLSPGKQQWAFGPAGRPGDRDRIRLLANRFVESYESLLDWAAELRGTTTPDRYRALYEVTARLADEPLRQIEEFVAQFAAATERGAGDLQLLLSYDLDPVEAELKKVQTT